MHSPASFCWDKNLNLIWLIGDAGGWLWLGWGSRAPQYSTGWALGGLDGHPLCALLLRDSTSRFLYIKCICRQLVKVLFAWLLQIRMQLASSSCCLINYCDGPKVIWDRMYHRGLCPLFKLFIRSPAHLVINLAGKQGWLGARLALERKDGNNCFLLWVTLCRQRHALQG